MSDDERTTRRIVAALPALAPRRIGGYAITGVLGRGGFGVVYAAERGAGRYAIKVLAAELAGDREIVKRFAREVRIVSLIDHPNIVDTVDVGHLDDGRPYFVMERVDGVGLNQLIGTRGPLAVGDALAILAQVCDALDAAHAAGVVHRDLKPANILVDARPGGWDVKLADFGIAKLLDPAAGATALTMAGQRLGTPETMAPEQIAGGEIDRRTDVYALGVVLYHALAGRYPFEHADPGEVERLHLTAVPSPLTPPRPALDAVIARAMARRPAHRPASATAFLAELRAAAGATDPLPAPALAPEAAAAATPTRRTATGPVGIIVATTGGPRADLDPAAIGGGEPEVDVRVSELFDGTVVCLLTATSPALAPRQLAARVVAAASIVRARLPAARIAARVAARATELHVAFNAAADTAPAPDRGAIGIDDALAALLGDDHHVERTSAGLVLVPP